MNNKEKSDWILSQFPTPDDKRKEVEDGWSDEALVLLELCRSKAESATSLHFQVDVLRHQDHAILRVQKALNELGWKVTENKGSDQRDGAFWHTLHIKPKE